MSRDIGLLKEIKLLTARGVKVNFYDCERLHLHHTLPYEAKYIEDVVIRIYTDSTLDMIQEELDEARRNLINLIETYAKGETNVDSWHVKEQSDLYQYMHQHLNFTERDLNSLKVKHC